MTTSFYPRLRDADGEMAHEQRPSEPNDGVASNILLSFMQRQQQPYKPEKEWTYYRISYRGIVALVSDPTQTLSFEDSESSLTASPSRTSGSILLNLSKTGAYLSYGEIIATCYDLLEIDVPFDTTQYPTQKSNNTDSPTLIRYRFIRVDDVLTGGYAVDAMSEPKDSTSAVIKDTLDVTDESPTISSDKDLYALSTHDYPSEDGISTSFSHDFPLTSIRPELIGSLPSTSQSISPSPFGYLLISSHTVSSSLESPDPCIKSIKISTYPHLSYRIHKHHDLSIVQYIPHPPLLCQVGTFFYRITSPTPIPILVGPHEDAPTLTHAKILPDTVQEISLRIGSVVSSYGESNTDKSSTQSHIDLASLANPTSLQDGVVYLRLSHKKGWIADRRKMYSPILGVKGDDRGRKSLESPISTASSQIHYQYQMVVKDITHLIENIGGVEGVNHTTNLESFIRSTPLNDMTLMKGHNDHPTMDNDSNDKNIGNQETSLSWEPSEKQIGPSSSSSVMSSLSSMSSSAMSTLSISTPLHIIKMRQRKKRVAGNQKGHGASEIVPSVTNVLSTMNIDSITSSKGNIQSPRRNVPSINSKSKPPEPPSLGSSEDIRNKQHEKGINQQNHRPVSTVSQEDSSSNPRSKPNLYLMRVHAPSGLKILDAPHFQVNHLIRRPSTSTASTHSGSSTSGVPSHIASSEGNASQSNKKNLLQPSSIFHTMNGGLISPKSTPAVAWEIDSSTGKRHLPRGLIFEASKRMEKASNFVEAMGLIKLADNTGWAVVPTKEELFSQYSPTHGDNFDKQPSIADAFEEIGNAILGGNRECDSNVSSSSKGLGCWLRITHRDGVPLLCSPLHSKHHSLTSDDASISDSSRLKVRETDSVSSSGSIPAVILKSSSAYVKKNDIRRKFSGEMRSKEEAIESDRNILTAAFRNSAQHHVQRNLMNFRISCGMCVEVEQSQHNDTYKSQVCLRTLL